MPGSHAAIPASPPALCSLVCAGGEFQIFPLSRRAPLCRPVPVIWVKPNLDHKAQLDPPWRISPASRPAGVFAIHLWVKFS